MMIIRVLFGLLALSAALAQSVPEWIYFANAPNLASLTFADLDGDSIDEVIGATYGRGPNPYQRGIIFVWKMDGDSLPGWPIEVTTGPIPSTPVIGDIDGDGSNELVVGNWSQAFVFRADGSLYPGWPRPYGASYSPTLEDLDQDGDLEIVYPSGSQIYVFQHNGSILPGFPVSVAHDQAGSPAVADIDGDSLHEIVAGINRGPVTTGQFELYGWNDDGSLIPGFPVFLCGIIKSNPALGDLENDGSIEIVANGYHSSNQDSLYVLDSQGNIRPGWPVCVPYCRLSPPALADIDRNGDLEILVGGSGSLYAYNHDGSSVSGWPVQVRGQINSSLVIAELDGDTSLIEILAKAQDTVYAFHANGTPVPGFPYFLDDSSHSGTTSPSPVIGDMDQDGDVEFCFSSCFGEIHFFDESSFFDEKFSEWPMFKHEERNTSYYPREVGPGIMEVEKGRISVNIWPNPFRSRVNIDLGSIYDAEGVVLEIYDISGRLVKRLDITEKRSIITWDGTDQRGERLSKGVYFLRLKGYASLKLILLK
ncbi:MAG TPA: T9SS type A sorting domain-containing protein [bacterium (Candidatus Stahlbacteria)]|nr:T9SS type A sorting domain-containing protein [Candidatus Stahlbacteria bacterium]